MMYSIVTLTYKRKELLEEAVHSVIQQTCKDWELLILNDCITQTIHYDHPQVRIYNFKERFKTIADKRNFGLDNFYGDWILQLDDDDLLLPTYLENLKTLIFSEKNIEWLSAQRPILYHNDPNHIYLSPVYQTNAFLCGRKYAKEFWYDSSEKNELDGFYKRTEDRMIGRKLCGDLYPKECGHVWRLDKDRKYSLTSFIKQGIPQNKWNDTLGNVEDGEGFINLSPHWKVDYTSIIKKNLKIVSPRVAYEKTIEGKELYQTVQDVVAQFQKNNPRATSTFKNPNENSQSLEVSKSIDSSKTSNNSWEKVKPTWANAVKFLNAAKSRGVVSTALNVVGIDNSMGDRVSEDILQQRKQSCFGNKIESISACDRLKYVEKRGYFCGGCGCGKNDLARLDADLPDEYTKLHYPHLECPLKKKGFSNYSEEPTLSIIITCCNESDYFLSRTIDSIRKTAGNRPEIIIVDDASTIPVKSKEKVIRNEERIGVGPSRHKGATYASGKYLLLTDGHMIFDDAWYDNFIERIRTAGPNDIFCGTCLGLDEKDVDLSTHKGTYHGARLELYNDKENQILEGKWISVRPEPEYEISCLMGAIYFVPKEMFLRVRGLSDIKMWGSDEPLLSLKTLLVGGRIFLLKNVRAGHVFRNAAPYVTNISYLLYNKIRIAKTILPDDLGELLIDKIPRNENFYKAMDMINSESEIIKEYKKYYKSIFIREFTSICDEYKIIVPK